VKAHYKAFYMLGYAKGIINKSMRFDPAAAWLALFASFGLGFSLGVGLLYYTCARWM
jgi:hypothetical protein